MTTYKIIRFNRDAENEEIETGLTLEEAQEHCQQEDTHGEGWFDGYVVDEEDDEEDDEQPGTMADYVAAHGITVEVLENRGIQRDKDNWEHQSFKLRLINNEGRTINTSWRQGMGITKDPADMADEVFDSLISDANSYREASGFEDWAEGLGYDIDSRKAHRIWQKLRRMEPKVIEFVGGNDEFEHIAYNIERL